MKRWARAFPVTLVATLCACDSAPDTAGPPAPAAVVAQVMGESNCGDASTLTAELYGSIERTLSWSAADMRCESMLRPDGDGVRLRFTGKAAERQLAIILALPGLEPGGTGTEIPTVATLTVEGSGRFFSTPNLDSCWSDISAHDVIDEIEQRYEVAGTLYCVAPLGEVNGEAAISIPKLEFRSIIDWGAA